MKVINLTRLSTPTNPEFGYGDKVNVIENNTTLYDKISSTCCNPYKVDGNNHIPWEKVYALITKNNNLKGKVINHDKFGKCILINEGKEIPTVNENSTHNGRKVADEVFIHRSIDPKWCGSKACITIPPCDAQEFFGLFKIGEEVVINII